MASKQTKTPHRDRTGRGPATADGGRSDAGRRAGGEPALDGAAAAMTAEVELVLSELLGDANGEIVLFNDSGLRRLALATDAVVVADGRAGPHRTATGQDVSGFRFLTFDNGLTVYYQPGLDLVVRGGR
jgi:hypothetical protein